MMKLTTSLVAVLIACGAVSAKAADLKLDADLPLAEASSTQGISFDLSFVGAPETVDLEKAYTAALQYQREVRRQRLSLAIRRNAAIALANKSLVEREVQKLDTHSASPEASPSIEPFSSSRPDPIVSNAPVTLDFTTPLEMNNLAATPEPPTWALFGVGAALMIFVVPSRGKKNKDNPKDK